MAEAQRIVLIGFRGAGKSTVARALATRTGRPVQSTDALIEARVAMTISEFVEREGWPAFRAVEREVIAALPDAPEWIIDCGGGVVEDAGNMAALQRNAVVVWIDADLDAIVTYLAESGDRPLLSETDLRSDTERHYTRRRPLYRRYAHLRVSTSEHAIEAVCDIILAHRSL